MAEFELYFRRSNGTLFAISRPGLERPPGFDPALHFFFEFDRQIDERTERGVEDPPSVRPATAEEIDLFDGEAEAQKAVRDVDVRVIKTILVFLVRHLNNLRTQPTQVFPALTVDDVRTELVAIYKQLNGPVE